MPQLPRGSRAAIHILAIQLVTVPLLAQKLDLESDLDSALERQPPERIASTTSPFRFLDLGAALNVAVGTSTERDESLGNIQGGGHDPRKRGLTLQNLEVSLLATVDPYFDFESYLLFFLDPIENETRLELEEAFLTTRVLPWGLHEQGLRFEIGHFLTEFGRINPRHPHLWTWLDQPVVNTRFFGPDGMRGPGVRLGWLVPLPWFCELHLGFQDARGETMASFLASDEFFEERPVGGREYQDREIRSPRDLVYLVRLANSWEIHEEVTTLLGLSGLVGPNATGGEGETLIFGGDFTLKWRSIESDQGWPSVTWQTEVIGRNYRADDGFGSTDTLSDWGASTQLLWRFLEAWALGLRFEIAGGSGTSEGDFASRAEDPFRDDRQRISPLVHWKLSEFSRIRLQVNSDFADHLPDDDAHSIWLGFEAVVGSHPAHEF